VAEFKRQATDQAEQQRLAEETRILQKVRHAQRDAFPVRFPGQVDHCLRLVMERLQYGLDKRGNVVVTDVDTWLLLPEDLADLAKTAYYLNEIRKGF
jgi:hypothetical protein